MNLFKPRAQFQWLPKMCVRCVCAHAAFNIFVFALLTCFISCFILDEHEFLCWMGGNHVAQRYGAQHPIDDRYAYRITLHFFFSVFSFLFLFRFREDYRIRKSFCIRQSAKSSATHFGHNDRNEKDEWKKHMSIYFVFINCRRYLKINEIYTYSLHIFIHIYTICLNWMSKRWKERERIRMLQMDGQTNFHLFWKPVHLKKKKKKRDHKIETSIGFCFSISFVIQFNRNMKIVGCIYRFNQ